MLLASALRDRTAYRHVIHWWRSDPLAKPLLALAAAATIVAWLGGGGAAVLVPLLTVALVVFAGLCGRTADRRYLITLTAGVFLMRVIALVGLDAALTQRAGAMFLDDARYITAASALADTWHGLPISQTARGLLADKSVANGYVWTAAVAMWMFGDVIAIKIVNSALAVLTGILVYRTSLNVGLPGSRVAAALVVLSPAFVLWSALALKDAYSIAFMAAAVCAATEIVRGGRPLPWLVATGAAIFAINDVRHYLFVLLAGLLPVGLFIATNGRRLRVGGLALLASAVLFTLSPPFDLFINPLRAVTAVRFAMAEGARSAFVEPLPVARGDPGFAFVVQVPGQTIVPASTPAIHVVAPGTQLVVQGQPAPSSVAGRATVIVQPGDIVVMAGATPGPTPSGPPSPAGLSVVVVRPEQVNVVQALAGGDPEDRLRFVTGLDDQLRHLPKGVLFLLAAPFPLLAQQASELAAVPEMLLWYASWILAAITLVRLLRERRYEYAYGVLLLGALGLVLSLTQGNVGTLIRHRTMLLPFVAPLAAAGLYYVGLAPRLRVALAGMRARTETSS